MSAAWLCVFIGLMALGLVVAVPCLFAFVGALGMGGPLSTGAKDQLRYAAYAVLLLPVLLLLGGFWLIGSRPQQAERKATRSIHPPLRNAR